MMCGEMLAVFNIRPPRINMRINLHIKIYVMPRHKAERIDLDERYIVISITDPPPSGGLAAIKIRWGLVDILRLEFHDLTKSHLKVKSDIHGVPLRECAMQPHHAGQVADFLEKHRSIGNIVIHCEAGASRSSSMACAIVDALGLDRSCIIRDEPMIAQPVNDHVYELTLEAFQKRCCVSDNPCIMKTPCRAP